MNKRDLNILFFGLYPLLAVVLSFALHVNALFSAVVFFGIPALYLCWNKPSFITKAALFSLLSIPGMIIVDYISEFTGTWLWPLPKSILPKLFGYVSIEVLVWAYLNVFVVVMFYEYFYDARKRSKLIYPREKKLVFIAILLFLIFLLLLLVQHGALWVPYWYLTFSLLILVPPVIFEGYKYPKVFWKLFKVACYFAYLNLAYELTALKIGWWTFPSKQFIGYVTLFNITFPFEEFFFWIILFTLTILSYYEYYFDREV